MPIIALLIMFCGFMVLKSKMGWMTFLFYLDIFGWAIQSIAINEFSAPRYAVAPPPNDPLLQGFPTVGTAFLVQFDMETTSTWLWAGVGYSVGAILLVLAWSMYAFTFVRYDRNIGSARVGSEDGDLAEKHQQTTGGGGGEAEAVALDLRVPSPFNNSGDSHAARSVLPFSPLTVAWKDLTYTVTLSSANTTSSTAAKTKTILNGCSGVALPGKMLALMGASGSGKTTLLDVLGGRKNSGLQTGSITLNGHPKDPRTFNRVAAYAEQQDLHMPLNTVRESVLFSSRLRLPASVSHQQREAFVDEVCELLELTHLRDARVGDPGEKHGLSPGERKRLTIAVELAANPPILFLDEPTSGLDARAAAVVMRVIKNVSRTGRTVICTIHQPSAELFFYFDDLLLLQAGGWQVYYGPLGEKGADLIAYLQASLPACPSFPRGYNPASWMLDVLSGMDSSGEGGKGSASMDGVPENTTTTTAETITTATSSLSSSPPSPTKTTRPAGESLQATFFTSPSWKQTGAPQLLTASTPGPNTLPLTFSSPYASSIFTQYMVNLQRFASMYNRNIPFNLGRMGAITGLMILFGIIYLKLADRSADFQGVRTLVAAIFMTTAFSAMLNMDAALPTLIKTRPNMYRETSSLMYDISTYTLALITVEVPWLLVTILLGSTIGYFMIGLAPVASTFFTHALVTFLLGATLVSFGHTVVACVPNFDLAQAVVGTLAPIMFLFGGMFSKVSSMPPGSRWVNTIDPIGYAFKALIPLHFYCTGTGCPNLAGVIDRWAFVKETYELSFEGVWPSVGYLALFVLGFQVLHFLAQRRFRHISR